MECTIEKSDNRIDIKFNGSLKAANIRQVYEQIKPYHMESCSIFINIEDINECDTAGLQLLYAYIQAVTKSGAAVQISTIPTQITDICRFTGIKLVD